MIGTEHPVRMVCPWSHKPNQELCSGLSILNIHWADCAGFFEIIFLSVPISTSGVFAPIFSYFNCSSSTSLSMWSIVFHGFLSTYVSYVPTLEPFAMLSTTCCISHARTFSTPPRRSGASAAKSDLGSVVSRKGHHVGTPQLVVSSQLENIYLPQNSYIASNSFISAPFITLFTLTMASTDLGNKSVPLEITEGIVAHFVCRAFASFVQISRLLT